MAEIVNNKTLFVLDKTPFFAISSGATADLDFVRSKSSPTLPPLLPISKSLWTVSVESCAEYCRIAWDLFPTEKLIRFIVSDTAAHIVNTWNASTQNLTHVMNAMSMVGVPQVMKSYPTTNQETVIHGLRAAIEALAEPTEQQAENMKKGVEVQNAGRVICITSARDNATIQTLEEIFYSVLMQQNTHSGKLRDSLPISKCHLVIINLYPTSVDTLIMNRSAESVSPILSTEIHSVVAPKLWDVLTHLILKHYDLASTTVTGIPMKEEQNAGSSANYDVEIFHSRNAHNVILTSELVLPKSVKEGSEYETITLKWCTPRGCGSSEMQNCIAQHRVTPVDVTSRPSSCLINFLLNGRSVLLEMPKKGGKLTSHLLSAHGGEIFIHTLSISRSSLEDLPSLSEGCGGKVIDYRIREFGQVMQKNKLFPKRPLPDSQMDENLVRARRDFHKNTLYFPLTLGSTIVYNIRQFLDNLLTNLNKPELTNEETVECQQIIYHIVNLESRHEPLPLSNMGHRLKGNKKEDQYRLLWTELEILASISGKTAILNCIRECRSKNPDATDKMEIDQAVRDLDSNHDKSHSSSYNRPTTESPMSPTYDIGPSSKKSRSSSDQNRSLFDMILAAEKIQNKKRIDFSGRLCTPINQVAKLYQNLSNKEGARTDQN